MALTSAYPGIKATFSSELGADLNYDVVVWKESGAEVVGLFVVPGSIKLYNPSNAPVSPDYYFAGYSYCP